MTIEERILAKLTKHGYFTWDDIRTRTGMTENFDKALLGLVADGEVLTAQVTDGKHRYTVAGYKLPAKI